jgi:DNA-binding PadR family transcriptional regulator
MVTWDIVTTQDISLTRGASKRSTVVTAVTPARKNLDSVVQGVIVVMRTRTSALKKLRDAKKTALAAQVGNMWGRPGVVRAAESQGCAQATAALAQIGCLTASEQLTATKRRRPTMAHNHGASRSWGRAHRGTGRFFERGGIKFIIMDLLRDGPRHGYDIIRAMEEHSRGLYSPSPGAVYPVLQALEDQDLLTSNTEGGKRVYSITEAGRAFLEEHRSEARRHEEQWAAYHRFGGHGEGGSVVSDLKSLFRDVMQAVRATGGDPEKLQAIRDVMQEAAARAVETARGETAKSQTTGE